MTFNESLIVIYILALNHAFISLSMLMANALPSRHIRTNSRNQSNINTAHGPSNISVNINTSPTPAPTLSPKPLPSLPTHSNLAVHLPIYICCSDHLSTFLSTNLPEPPTHSTWPCSNTMKCFMFTSEWNTTNDWAGTELNTIMWLLSSDGDSYTGNKSIEGNWGC